MTNILIVEDDKAISHLIEGTLTREGFRCVCAMDGEEGLARFDERSFDLVLLDLMLPKYSGFELLEYMRPSGTPVIILSAMGQVQDRIKGLRMGADDYLVKPFQIGELLARIESVLRRTQRNTKLFCRDVTVDPEARIAWKAGVPVDLTVKEFDLLVVLLRHSNVALTRAFLYEQVWAEEYMGETRTLDNHIQRLRKKLGWMDTIQTVPRMGYRLWNPGKEGK